jgi:phage shock protein PspC (stress-responsive transcriptional regulator)
MRTSSYRPQLRRNPNDAILGGVCSGLASYLGTDKTIVRIVAVVCGLLITKLALLCYGVAWLLLDD